MLKSGQRARLEFETPQRVGGEGLRPNCLDGDATPRVLLRRFEYNPHTAAAQPANDAAVADPHRIPGVVGTACLILDGPIKKLAGDFVAVQQPFDFFAQRAIARAFPSEKVRAAVRRQVHGALRESLDQPVMIARSWKAHESASSGFNSL